MLQELKRKIISKKAVVSVIGLGYVGLPLAVRFAKCGFKVFGLENDKGRLEKAKNKICYIEDVSNKDLVSVINKKKLIPDNDFSRIRESDIIVICVPTPLKRKYTPDISYILKAVRVIAKYQKKGSLIILESTTFPGTTDEFMKPILEKGGLICGKDFFLAFSPERIDPNNMEFPVHKIPKIVGGTSKAGTELAAMFYGSVLNKVVKVSSARVAETAKLLENTFRIVNIALVNEMAKLAHKLDIDIWEVIEAAKTKPFGFMPFYPGPGCGGHCLSKNEFIFIKNEKGLRVLTIQDLLKEVKEDSTLARHKINDCLYIKPKNTKILTFNLAEQRTVYSDISILTERKFSGEMFRIFSEDGRRISVTDRHPMIIKQRDNFAIKYASELNLGDEIPIALNLPKDNFKSSSQADLINYLHARQELWHKFRVRAKNFHWRDYSNEIKELLGEDKDKYWDYKKSNYLPLHLFYRLNAKVNVGHGDLYICSGSGPSGGEIPAVIEINKDFCRLLGYFLSEGCITEDSKTMRVRFSFNRNEQEYIDDVCNILKNLGLKFSIYSSKKFYTECIKVSSLLFGIALKDILKTGVNSYNMSIPEQVFSLNKACRMNLLSGILRGDGSAEVFSGKKLYRKYDRKYFHNLNSASVSYFTINNKLLQQVMLLCQDLKFIPTFKTKRNILTIFGYNQINRMKDLFLGEKLRKISNYLKLCSKRPQNKTFRSFNDYATVKVKRVEKIKENKVYSMEVNNTHTIVSSYGIISHNCIPDDPLYLHWKATKHGYTPKFIKLASKMNAGMPNYIVTRLNDLLGDLSDKKILVLGVTYKKDVRDLRKSPSIDLLHELLKAGADVRYFDPIIPFLKFNGIDLKSVKLSRDSLKKFSCVIVATDHSDVNYDLVLKNSSLIFDTRNVYRNKKDKRIVKL